MDTGGFQPSAHPLGATSPLRGGRKCRMPMRHFREGARLALVRPGHCIHNGSTYAVNVVRNIAIPNAHDAVAVLGQPLVADRIPRHRRVIAVAIAIDFHDQSMLRTEEIDNVGTDWNLSPKSQPLDPGLAQVAPERQLRDGHVTPHRFGKTALHRRDRSMRHRVNPLPKFDQQADRISTSPQGGGWASCMLLRTEQQKAICK